MIKKFKIFEDTINPDLRKLGNYVKCIKSIPKKFTKDHYYKVNKIYGNPQRAIEIFKINDYMPIECIKKCEILDNNNIPREFYIDLKVAYDIYSLNFFKYFEIQEHEQIINKYNL